MAIEDIDNLTRPLSDLVGEQGERAAKRKKQLAEVRATRAAGMTADEAKAAAERGDFGEVGQEEKKSDFKIERDPILDTVNPLDLSNKGINALMRKRIPLLVAADAIVSKIPDSVKKNMATEINTIYSGIFNKAREALGFEPQYVMMSDGSIGFTGAEPFQRIISEGASTTGKSVDDAIKNKNTPINKALLDMGDELISTMTAKEVAAYIRKNYNIRVSDSAISAKNLKVRGAFDETATRKIRDVLKTIDNPDQYTVEQLLNLPDVKKVMDEFGGDVSRAQFNKVRSQLGIKSKVPTFIDRLNINEDELINFLKQNPSTTTTQLKVQFPKLKEVKTDALDKWRQSNNVTRTRVNEKSILVKSNPELEKLLDFVPEGSTTPIKHKDVFSEIITMNKKTGPIDAVRTKLVQAHGIGEGGISKASDEIIKSKVAMIPNKFLKGEELPKFFLTRSGNIKHREIENDLVLALIKKYDLLGYNFVDGAWKQTKKVNQKSVSKELKLIEDEISIYQKDLKDLDAYTLFYNPVKDKMVTHGKPLSEIPGLSNLLNKVLKGEKKLSKGGIVSIEEMIQPINLKYTSW